MRRPAALVMLGDRRVARAAARAAVLAGSAALVALLPLPACTATADVPAAGGAVDGDAGTGAGAAAPTWFRDVEPIVQVECAGCHTQGGPGGFVLDRFTTTSLAALVAERVAAREMPPWPPGPNGVSLAGARALRAEAIATITAWASAGAPAGDSRDHVERAPRAGAAPARPPDLRLGLPAGEAYTAPPSAFVTDEVRCFVLDMPAGAASARVTASRWVAGVPAGVHNLGGVVVDGPAAAALRARSGRDGRAGFECGGGIDDATASPDAGAAQVTAWPPLGASGTGSTNEPVSVLPPGTAVEIPAGGAVVMRVHYGVKHLADALDRSGVELWLDDAAPGLLVNWEVRAPVEVPCPTGGSTDPSSACNRDNAFTRLAGTDAGAARARADTTLAACGTTLAAATSAVAPGSSSEHFLITSSCSSTAPFDGTIRMVEARMQTHGASVRVEAEAADGSWTTVLDIPRWRWAWAGAYVLEQGVPVATGKRLRVSCTFDNGTANQWSALTGEAGHGQTARPPQLAPGYLVAAPHRAAEACTAGFAIERSR